MADVVCNAGPLIALGKLNASICYLIGSGPNIWISARLCEQVIQSLGQVPIST